IVTLATLSVAQGIGLVLTNSQMVIGVPGIVDTLGGGDVGPVPIRAVVVLIVGLAGWWFVRWTQWGRWIYATGGIPEAARRMSIPVPTVLISVYVVSGLFAGVAAIL